MIDGVRLGAAVVAPDRVAERLVGTRIRSRSGATMHRGKVGSLRATMVDDRLWLRGSLPTFLGLESPLGSAGVECARRRIETHLGEDLGDAHVVGMEITADLTLPRPCSLYLPLLHRLPRFQRNTYGSTGVAFVSESRSLSFYDRVAHRRRRRLSVPAGHVLRVEIKLSRRVQRQLQLAGPVTLALLHDPDFQRFLVGWWAREVARVERVRAPLSLPGDGDIWRWVTLGGVHAFGYDTVEAAIREQQDAGVLKRSTAGDYRTKLRRLAADPALTVEDERVAELDAAIREATDRAHRLA